MDEDVVLYLLNLLKKHLVYLGEQGFLEIQIGLAVLVPQTNNLPVIVREKRRVLRLQLHEHQDDLGAGEDFWVQFGREVVRAEPPKELGEAQEEEQDEQGAFLE